MRKQIITLFWSLSLVAACALDVTAHPPEEHEPGHPQRTELPKGLVLPATAGPHPWSDKPVLSDPNRFQIAIMTDRTGGHRPGIWMKAVESVNLLRPDFVMSVGDLIEGYTEDPEQVEREWQEFLGFIDQMEMKFFFVGGNHDLTNPMMHEKWRKHFGPKWYSFDYNGVHFICLCSEDPNFRIGETQMNWLKADLKKSATARWTLVFLHKPLWFISERYRSFGMRDSTNWPAVEKLLHGRRHTVFAGHTHHYAQFHRNGATYYQLATTGGGSQLRGIPYGEFDHIMWLTMEKEGPYVANLLLDGIVPGDRVTEETLARFRTFLAKAKLEVAPILLGQGEGLSEGQIDIRLINEFDAPVRVSGRIEGLPLRGLTVDPVSLDLEAAPQASESLSVKVQFSQPVPIADLGNTLFRAHVESLEKPPLVADIVIPVVIDRRFDCPHTTGEVVLDGNARDWKELAHQTEKAPLVVGPAHAWQGKGDAHVAFDFSQDKKSLNFFARVSDDKILEGDQLVLFLDTRPISARSRQTEFVPGFYRVGFPAVEFRGPLTMQSAAGVKATCEAVVARQNEGYTIEAAIPLSILTDQQGKDWHSFQAALLLEDTDEPGDPVAGILWRGTRRIRNNNLGYGHFVNQPPSGSAR